MGDTLTVGDPYNLADLLGRLLQAAATGDRKTAMAIAACFDRLGVVPAFSARLRRIATDRQVVQAGECFFVDPPPDLPLASVANVLSLALAVIAGQTGRASPILWLDFTDGDPRTSLAEHELRGLRRLSLSRYLHETEGWESILWHEAAHLVIMSGCTFLDEGWAIWWQQKSGITSAVPVSSHDCAHLTLSPAIAALPVMQLLRWDWRSLWMEDIAETDHQRRSLYVQAYRVVSSIVDEIGLKSFADVLEAVRGGADPWLALSGTSRAEAEMARLTPNAAGAALDLTEAEMAFGKGRRLCSVIPYQKTMRRLEMSVGQESTDLRALALYGRMLAHAMILTVRAGMPASPAQLATLARISVRLQSKLPAIALLLRGLGAVIEAEGGVEPVRRATLFHQVGIDLHQAVQHAPEDSEALLALARYNLSLPTEVRDVSAAISSLQTAARDLRYRHEAMLVACQFELPEVAHDL